jgi:hypothetical protein
VDEMQDSFLCDRYIRLAQWARNGRFHVLIYWGGVILGWSFIAHRIIIYRGLGVYVEPVLLVWESSLTFHITKFLDLHRDTRYEKTWVWGVANHYKIWMTISHQKSHEG